MMVDKDFSANTIIATILIILLSTNQANKTLQEFFKKLSEAFYFFNLHDNVHILTFIESITCYGIVKQILRCAYVTFVCTNQTTSYSKVSLFTFYCWVYWSYNDDVS